MAKVDTANGFENKDKAVKALEKMKALEAKLNGSLQTTKLPNGVEITSNNEERIKDFINSYGRI